MCINIYYIETHVCSKVFKAVISTKRFLLWGEAELTTLKAEWGNVEELVLYN